MRRVANFTKEGTIPFSSSGAFSGEIGHDYAQGNCESGSRSENRDRQGSSAPAAILIGQRPRMSRVQDDKRGPGAYMSVSDHSDSEGPAYSFGRKRTPERDPKKDCYAPGPGEYSSGLGYYATKSAAPAYSMGARCGPSAFSVTSGQGADDFVKGSRGITKGVSYPVAYKPGQNFSQVPGPGSYNTSTVPGGPSYSMGKKSTPRGLATNRIRSPGPGSYDVTRKTSGPAFSIAPKARK